MCEQSANSEPLKISVVISNLTFGGAERQVVELCNNIDRNKFDLHVFILSGHAPLARYLDEAENRLHIVRKKNKFDVAVIFRLAKEFRRLGIQVVHGFLFDAEIASRLAARLSGASATLGSERNTKNNFGSIKKFIYRHSARMLDACIANSSAGAKFNQSRTGLPESAYHVVHNGVDTVRFMSRDNAALRKELGIDAGRTVIGMFGSFKRQKNHPFLLRAIQQLVQRGADVTFVFVGTTIHEGDNSTDEYSRSVVDLVGDLGVDKYCEFLGAKDDVERYYNLCDITVLPSLFEGTPNVALESMASGVPVIATDVSDNRYVIPDGRCGYIVELDDVESLTQRLQLLINNKALREQLGQQAREWVIQEFSLEKMASKMGQVYLDVLRASQK